MKPFTALAVFLCCFILLSNAESASSNDTEAAQWKRIDERMRDDVGITNFLSTTSEPLLRSLIVHPAFGIRWDEVPPPTLTSSSSMSGVNSFISTNGWNMHSGVLGPFVWAKNKTRIRGLPWNEIQHREFYAVTCEGILFVQFTGWHYNDNGVAFNPKTNSFDRSIKAFKPIKDHWYVWAQSDDNFYGPRIYEGGRTDELSRTVNGIPIGSYERWIRESQKPSP